MHQDKWRLIDHEIVIHFIDNFEGPRDTITSSSWFSHYRCRRAWRKGCAIVEVGFWPPQT
jgi:hypothetical protein